MATPHEWQLDILLAEDTPSDIELFQLALKRCGEVRTVQLVRDGREVLAYLCGEPPFEDPARQVPNIIFMDLKMPRMTGLDVLRWLRQHPEHVIIPVVMLSSSALDEDVITAYRLGVNAYFQKPTNFLELEKILRSILDFWTHARRPPQPSRFAERAP
jgi:CheY-like chemotaxis protein